MNPVGKMNKCLSSLEKKHNNYVTAEILNELAKVMLPSAILEYYFDVVHVTIYTT